MDTFPIGPVSAKPLWFFAVIIVILVGVLALIAWSSWSTRNSRVEVDATGIRLVGDLWGRHIPFEKLRLDEARRIDLRQERDYRLRRRTMGTGLPGYAAGWFRLANGEKALVYVTTQSEVVYIPTTEGYSLLLSVTVWVSASPVNRSANSDVGLADATGATMPTTEGYTLLLSVTEPDRFLARLGSTEG